MNRHAKIFFFNSALGGAFEPMGVQSWLKTKRDRGEPLRITCATMTKGGKKQCHHGVRKFWCKPCGGGGYCEHDMNRYKCKECKDAGKSTSLCEHNQPRTSCGQCGTTKCQHGNSKKQCHQCGKGCPHGKRKTRCSECGGGALCPHGRRKDKSCSQCAA